MAGQMSIDELLATPVSSIPFATDDELARRIHTVADALSQTGLVADLLIGELRDIALILHPT